jgi:hypothetical protein
MAGPAGTNFDSRPIQSVTLVSYPDGAPALVSSGPGQPAQVYINGAFPAGTNSATSTINPILIGGLDTNNPQLLQPAQMDSFLDLQVSLGTRLDVLNDALNTIASNGYPTQQRVTASTSANWYLALAPANATGSAGNPTPLANYLGLAGLPNIAPVQWARFTISNNNTSQPITSLKIVWQDTVDASQDTITYTYPLTISQSSGVIARYWMPFPQHYGIYPNAVMQLTTNAAAATTGYIQSQVVWGFNPVTSYPVEWQWTVNTNITSSTSTQLLAAPPSGTRIAIEELMVTNGSTTVATDLTIQAGSNGTAIWDQYGGIGGMGFKFGPFPNDSAYRMALATALFAKATASGGNWFITGKGHYEPL